MSSSIDRLLLQAVDLSESQLEDFLSGLSPEVRTELCKLLAANANAERRRFLLRMQAHSDEVETTVVPDSLASVISGADRNLLFGVLGWQAGVLSESQLLTAMRAWIFAKGRTIGEILIEQSVLTESQHTELEQMVASHLRLHQDNAGQALASLSSVPAVAASLREQIDDVDVQASLSHFVQTFVPASGSKPGPSILTSGGESDSRFHIIRPHARGGLGEVFVANDQELNRQVALKEIQPQFADQSESRSRFVLEAEVTGGLEHPGIVPVYGLGQYEDGRPYYAMRFIKGDSLKDAIKAFHEADDLPESERSLQLRKLLGRFVDVCQAVSYAHSRGVLHRDLKPGNIMLGKYGETLVVDWGLAKVAGRSEGTAVAEEQTLQPQSGSGVTPTVMGSAIGTPAYMPPEQAAGRLNELGPASDVYSLGATLYHLLTGASPFAGKNLPATLEAVQSGNFATPRSVRTDIPRAIEAVCLKAMSLEQTGRYDSPTALSNDVERFLADEPVKAFEEPWVVRARRWVRRHPTLVTTTAAVVLLSVAGLAAFSSVVSDKNKELNNRNTQLMAAKELAETNEEAARQQSQLALETLTSVVNDIQSGLKNVAGSSAVRRKLLATSLGKLEKVSTRYLEKVSVDRQTTRTLLKMGDLVLHLGSGESSGPRDGSRTATGLALRYFRRAQTMAERIAIASPNDREANADLSIAYEKLGDVYLQMGDTNAALEAYVTFHERSRDLAQSAIEDTEAQRLLSVSYQKLGDARLQMGDARAALSAYSKALETKRLNSEANKDSRQARRDLSVSYEKLGDVQVLLGDTPRAMKSHSDALELRRALAESDKDNTQAQRDLAISYEKLGNIQFRSGDTQAALTAYQDSFQTYRDLADSDAGNAAAQRDLAVSYNKVGDVHFQLGDVQAAHNAYNDGLEICLSLSESDKENAETLRDLSVSYNKLGTVQLRLGKTQSAVRSFNDGLEIRRTLADSDKGSARAQRDLAVSYSNLGNVHLQLGDAQSALKAYSRFHEISRTLAELDQGNKQAQRDLSISYEKLADVQLRLGDTRASLDACWKALETSRSLAESDKDNARVQGDLARLYTTLGDVQIRARDPQAALQAYQSAMQISRRLAEADPDNALVQDELHISYQRLGNVRLQLRDTQAALAAYNDAIEIAHALAEADKDNAEAQKNLMISHYKVAIALRSSGNYSASATEFESAAGVLSEMINRRQLLHFSTRAKADMDQRARRMRLMAISLGDWEEVLEQPLRDLPAVLDIRAIEFATRKDYATATQAASKLRELENAENGNLYNAACVFALAAASVKAAEGEELATEHSEQRQTWINEGMATLKQAVDKGWADFDHMRIDTDLTVLRDLPEFKALGKPKESD